MLLIVAVTKIYYILLYISQMLNNICTSLSSKAINCTIRVKIFDENVMTQKKIIIIRRMSIGEKRSIQYKAYNLFERLEM